MTIERKALLFSDVDDLAFSASQNVFVPEAIPFKYTPSDLGPLLELLHLSRAIRILNPLDLLAQEGTALILEELQRKQESWINPNDKSLGFIRTQRKGNDADIQLTNFLVVAQRVGREISGLPARESSQIVAAMNEMECNIHEHSGCIKSGLLAFFAAPNLFEFVVSDYGIGVLKSLRSCKAYSKLSDHGSALELALSDGVSRYGPKSRRGHGFRSIFVGLANLQAKLRFRSGDHALLLDGTNLEVLMADICQKAPIEGFFVSVKCYT